MNIKFSTYAKKSGLSQVLVRMYYKGFDVSAKLDLFLEPSDWDLELQLAKSSNLVNEKLLKLKSEILIRYNEDYTRGQIINSIWLKRVISDVFDRPHDENSLICQDKYLYFTDFCKYWLKDKSAKWKVNSKEYIGKSLLAQYEKFVEVFCEFEKTLESKIVLKDMSVDDFYEFANYLESAGYNPKTIERQIGRMKFFCLRCDEESIKISPAFRQRIYIDKDDDEIESVYLSEEEIDKIYNLQIDDENLDNARDLLVISCFSGLRVSDLMHSLDTSKVKDGIISIRTKKTGAFVKIPVHFYVSEILNKRLGNLPRKFNDYEYNCLLKILGEKAGINKVVYGKLWDSSKKRKVLGYRPKFMYLSSHCGRRSFCTNLSGKVPDEIIMAVAGWTQSSMKSHYNKTSKTEYANKLKSYWNGE
jgi:integrase